MKEDDAPDFAELSAEYATPGGVNEQVARELREAGAFDTLACGARRRASQAGHLRVWACPGCGTGGP